MIAELAAKVFATRNAAHRQHWKTTSYAEHMALGSFYDAIIGQIDAIVEAYQGLFERIEVMTVEDLALDGDFAGHLRDEVDWIESVREDISQGSAAIENLIDELAGTYMKTLYLLTLK